MTLTTLSRRVHQAAFALLLCLASSTGPAFGQVTTGTVEGSVLDPQGRPLPRAEVRVVDGAHQADRKSTRLNSSHT